MSRVFVSNSKSHDFTKSRYIPYVVFIKRYTIRDEIFCGGFGFVYAANNAKTNEPIAVKFLPAANVCAWELLNGRLVPIEVVLLARCQSVPGVIRMHHYTKCPNNGFLIAMERPLSGMDLLEFNNQHGPLSDSIVRNFFSEIVEIVQSCAMQGVVHLDIKLENIIVDVDSGELKLIDFGSGAWLSKTPLKKFCGTWLYAPPEWFLHRKFDAISATVWSLGVLLYTMLEDQYPFANPHEIIKNSLQWGKISVSFECQELIVSCLASRPEDRPALERILSHSWLNEPKHEIDEWKNISMKKMTVQEMTRAIENLRL